MIDVANKLDEIEGRIMSGLKDFQQATVNRIDAKGVDSSGNHVDLSK